jgi:lactaldehyde reductase
LGAIYDTPHGIANAILLPHVMKFNGEVSYERFREILIALNIDASQMTKEQVISSFVALISELSKKVGITQGVADVGGKEEDIEMLAKKAIKDACTPGNPREVTVEDIMKIYKEAM